MPDIVIAHATVFEAVTGTFLPDRSLWVKDGRIARVAPAAEPPPSGAEVLDASGLTLVPGLIDGHTHLTRLFVPEFVRALLPTGVTSSVIETMEYGATHGFRGIRPFIEALRDQPLRLFYLAPALCGLTEEEEPAPLTPAELDELLADPLCLGLGESYWSNALLPGPQGVRVRELIARTLAAGKVAEGHTAGAKGARLDAYAALGVSSCHEPISVEEALEVYRRGLFVMLREGGIRRDLETMRPLFDMPLDFRRFALVTDSVDPERLATWGCLDEVVREALELGIPPHVVYRMASTNVAEHFRLENDLGYLAPGRWADLVAIPAPDVFRPVFVMVGGKVVFDRGRVLATRVRCRWRPRCCARSASIPRGRWPSPVRRPRCRPPAPCGWWNTSPTWSPAKSSSPGRRRPRPISSPCSPSSARGASRPSGACSRASVSEKAHTPPAPPGTPPTSWSWVVTISPCGRRCARLVEIGGGVVFARGADVVAESKEPICAVASLDTAEQVRADLRAVADALHQAGVPWEDPLLAVDTLTTPAIPHLRVTHRGYVRLRDRALLPLEG